MEFHALGQPLVFLRLKCRSYSASSVHLQVAAEDSTIFHCCDRVQTV